jgi:very-short-patch-repair endonuclease
MAASKQRNFSQVIGPDEEQVACAFTEAGIEFTRQLAIGPYNLDFGVDRMAVEVHRAPHGPHLDRVGLYRRVDYLTDHGWPVLYAWCPSGFTPDDLHQIVALVDELRLLPAEPGKYTVFRCQGNLPTRSGRKAYDGAYMVTTGGVYEAARPDRRVRRKT